MENIIQLKLTSKSFYTEDDKIKIFDFFNDLVKQAIKLNIWDESIKGLIITDDFINEIEKKATELKLVVKVSQEKESVVISKILFNQKLNKPEHYIFFDSKCLDTNLSLHRIVIAQFLSVSNKKIIPIEVREQKFNFDPITLDDYIKFASTEWCKQMHNTACLNEFGDDGNYLINHNSFLTAFKRNLKKNLFEYHSDKLDKQERIEIFWHNYFDSIETLFLRIIENQTTKVELLLKESEPSKYLIDNVILEIIQLTKRCLKHESYDTTKLKELIKDFSAYFEIFLEDETEHNFRVRPAKDPKDYFQGIVETEPRLICFMDILGFSDLINEYDDNITSTILQDIQESFALAKDNLLVNKASEENNALKYLKYQTFSDNICISIPYFDSEHDFIANFNLLSTYVRGFQLIMMTKGFYTRGGISKGSYYADGNIIFSKGLVNAYTLESKKAIYPRVIIDESIIKKLFDYGQRTKAFGIDKVIIFDWENIAFLNPFSFAETSIQQIKLMLNELSPDLDDSIASYVKGLGEKTIALLDIPQEQQKKDIQPIKNDIIEKMQIYRQNSNVFTKYVWLFEFIGWLQKDDTTKLKFEFMSDRIVDFPQSQNKK